MDEKSNKEFSQRKKETKAALIILAFVLQCQRDAWCNIWLNTCPKQSVKIQCRFSRVLQFFSDISNENL